MRKYQGYLSRKNKVLHVSPSNSEGKSKQNIWLDRASFAASLAQVVMVIVVVIGYVFTVRPVFQKEVVSEDLARLQLEQRAWARQIEEQKQQLKIGEQKNSILEEERIKLVTSLAGLKQEHEISIRQADEASKQARAAVVRAATLDKSYKEALARQVAFRRSELTGSGKIASPWVNVMKRPYVGDFFSYEKVSEVSTNLKKINLQPLKAAETVLHELKAGLNSATSASSKLVESELVEAYERGLSKNSNLLVCPAPNFDAWQSNFSVAMERVDHFRNECVDSLFRKQAVAQKWSVEFAEDVKKSKGWKSTLKEFDGMCLISLRYSVSRLFVDAWGKADEPCKSRYMSASAIVLDEEKELSTLREFIPPNVNEIDSNLLLTIKNW
ncbi:hypothetical protein [Pseudomonas sp. 22 E 5]|nr:hypothetical protein [Pseudomonas sp. 22 E 5]